jgi:hypothetical protein
MRQMGCQKGILDERRVFGKKGREDNKKDGYDEQTLDETEAAAAYAVDPT